MAVISGRLTMNYTAVRITTPCLWDQLLFIYLLNFAVENIDVLATLDVSVGNKSIYNNYSTTTTAYSDDES